jgi:cation:H+ antiporter
MRSMLASTLFTGWAGDYPLPAILAGLVLLVIGADVLVRGAVWIALMLGMSRMAVGLTLVAIGTSLPELLVSLTAARTGRSEIAMANVIGSNTANVLLIVGAAAAIRAIVLRPRKFELTYMLVATALAGVPFVVGGRLDTWLGIVMLVMLTMFCVQLLLRERAQRRNQPPAPTAPASTMGWLLHVGLVAFGLAMLAYGAEWLVEGSATVAADLGLSEAIIGMTIVAVGTSLPELATSAVAAVRGQPEICIGNVVGSNIFNVGAVLGTAGVLQPFPVDTASLGRLMVVTVLSAIALVVVLRTRGVIGRGMGIVFLAAYVGFLGYEVQFHGG